MTILERQIQLLDKMAAERYAGNRSACLRAAIEDHAKSLEGENEFKVKQLVTAVQDLEGKIGDLQESLQENLEEKSTDEDLRKISQHQSKDSGRQSRIYDLIRSQGSISLDQIASQVDGSLVELKSTLQTLCDQGLVSKTRSSGRIEYEINMAGVSNDE
ncbi:hypothetical protein [Natrarchaeobaculum aegyptiacum]|uniref:hypothetical protein n=1 Tax=Natrarchaeobaculum aegyptiacum TaxID=745377 RepID=UPI0012603C8D|nr:hypothetical protein [Natrarchaeobaculum aegyptiacum]